MLNNNRSSSVNMGVSWFYGDESNTQANNPRLNNNNNKYETVDLIDIEDEDHSFAAFFIGMKTGPSPYVKKPLVRFA